VDSNDTANGQEPLSDSDTATEQSQFTETVYQSGSFSNDSSSLASYGFSDQGSETIPSSSSDTFTTLDTEDSCEDSQRETGNWEVELAGQLRNPRQARTRNASTLRMTAGLPAGQYSKRRTRRPKPWSCQSDFFFATSDPSAATAAAADGPSFWISSTHASRCGILDF
jgi:hypothetical protein